MSGLLSRHPMGWILRPSGVSLLPDQRLHAPPNTFGSALDDCVSLENRIPLLLPGSSAAAEGVAAPTSLFEAWRGVTAVEARGNWPVALEKP